jgi:hypothetical protein
MNGKEVNRRIGISVLAKSFLKTLAKYRKARFLRWADESYSAPFQRVLRRRADRKDGTPDSARDEGSTSQHGGQRLWRAVALSATMPVDPDVRCLLGVAVASGCAP